MLMADLEVPFLILPHLILPYLSTQRHSPLAKEFQYRRGGRCSLIPALDWKESCLSVSVCGTAAGRGLICDPLLDAASDRFEAMTLLLQNRRPSVPETFLNRSYSYLHDGLKYSS